MYEGRLETAQGQLYDFENSSNEQVQNEISYTRKTNKLVKSLETATLLVIQETLLEDFVISDKKEQEQRLNNIGDVNIDPIVPEEDRKIEEVDGEEEKKAEEEKDIQVEGCPEERAAKNSLKSVKFDLLIKQILLPFFQIQTRILQKGNVFEIGSIKFLVAATTPFKQGKITTKTKIR